MDSTFHATHAALGHFDAVDRPALDAMRRTLSGTLDLLGFDEARKCAADRVRAAYLVDTTGVNTQEIVELMSVDGIRQAIGGTFIGRLLARLP